MSIDIKPCPFCGGRSIKTKHDDGRHWEECQTCFATGPAGSRYTDEDNGDITWNTRHQPVVCREAFEDQCRGHSYSIKRASDVPDCYEQNRTQIAWQFWQTARGMSLIRESVPPTILSSVIDRCHMHYPGHHSACLACDEHPARLVSKFGCPKCMMPTTEHPEPSYMGEMRQCKKCGFTAYQDQWDETALTQIEGGG